MGDQFLSSALQDFQEDKLSEATGHRSHRSRYGSRGQLESGAKVENRRDEEERSSSRRHRSRSRDRERDPERESRRRKYEEDDHRSSRSTRDRDDRRDRDYGRERDDRRSYDRYARDDRRDYDRRDRDDRRDYDRQGRPPSDAIPLKPEPNRRDREPYRERDRGDRFDRGGDRRPLRDARPDHRDARGGRGNHRDDGFPSRARSPTPEGTIPISKRKRPRTGWDVKPPGFEQITALQAKMTGRFNLPGQTRPTLPMTYFTESNMGAVDMPQMTYGSMEDNFPPGITYARQSRRLYVGGIGPDATVENLTAFFNDKMREMGLAHDDNPDVPSPDPVVNVQINREKGYAFVELRSSEEAGSGLGLDGAMFQGQMLKIRRPKDYLGAEMMGSLYVPGIVSTNVGDSAEKIFIGGLPSYLTDDQVIELLKSFGEIKAFNLVKEMSGQSKGFAFAEYVDPAVTDVACQGLNGMELGDRYLVVQRATMGQGGRSNAGGGLPPGAEGGDTSTAVQRVNGSGAESAPTRVLQMLNMVTPEELLDDEEYQEILEDTKDECSNYGEVIEVRIPRPIKNHMGRMDQRASEKIPNLGKVFVMFDTVEAAKKAMANIAGRQFASKTVICAYADEAAIVAT